MLCRARWFAVYYWSLILMLAFLVLAVAVDWHGRQPGTHAIVGTLIALGGFMVWRAEQARRVRGSSSPRFIEHLGFTLVGLIDAFVVVTVFNLDAPPWLVIAVGVTIALAGHTAIGAVAASRRAATAQCVRFGIVCSPTMSTAIAPAAETTSVKNVSWISPGSRAKNSRATAWPGTARTARPSPRSARPSTARAAGRRRSARPGRR